MNGEPAEISIRSERPGDEATLFDVVEAAFGSPIEARIVDALRASDDFIPDLSLVAELDGRVVGHVMISYATLQDGDVQHRIASLAPLAVDPGLQRRGIGSALVREVTARAERRSEPLVVLQGDPNYYGGLGFEHSAPLGIRLNLPSWAPPEAAQVMRLAGYDAALHGVVVYPPAFDEAEGV